MKPPTALHLFIYVTCLLATAIAAAQHYDDAEALGLLPEEQVLEPNIHTPSPAASRSTPIPAPGPIRSSAAPVASAPAAAAAAPVTGAGYALQPGDVLQVSVWNEESLNLQVLVRPDGGFSYPLAGEIEAQGKTTEQVRAELANKLSTYIPDPEVSVSLIQVAGNKVYVVGKVQRPGEFVMNKDLDVMQALSLAGGTTTFADVNDIKILRRQGGQQVAIPFNYSAVINGSMLEQNIVLQNGDVVVVP
jgi:polysaccharide export outer membrane protein